MEIKQYLHSSFEYSIKDKVDVCQLLQVHLILYN